MRQAGCGCAARHRITPPHTHAPLRGVVSVPPAVPCCSRLPALLPRQVRNVELLKIRFGEGSLHKCEVMLKDVSDSKRLDTFVHKESDKQSLQHRVPAW